ncbi:hypothetical protein DFH09DRAFT_1325221 [Mycena vulgaris]|nr:hypothetical protein DFH09DRAFT_1325221 [Mycena vulgaris]
MDYIETFSVALLCLIPTVYAHGSAPYPIVRNDLHCLKGSYTSFVQNSYSYNAPLDKFVKITQSFLPLVIWWPCPNTTGTDNIPGATRSGIFDGSRFNETLTMYFAHPDVLTYTWHGQPL